MDLTYTAEQTAFREEVREWLHANKPREKRPRFGAEMRAFDVAWQRAQHAAGWAGIAWPREYGGRGLSLLQQLIWHEEYARADAPYIGSCFVGMNHGGPTLIMRGTQAQKSHHLPRILNADSLWCQGFSEPGAGSDLAALKTRAEIDGDHLVVNGQKIWTSFGQFADYQELLVRTDSTGAKQHGITWVICDMHAPGIDVRPIQTMAGDFHFCEVFYNDVRIPLSNVVGELHQGWSVAQSTLGFERGTAMVGVQVEISNKLDHLVALARERLGPDGRRPLIQDDEFARRLATARAETQAMRAMTYAMISRLDRGGQTGAEASLVRVHSMELFKRVALLALEMLGPEAMAATDRDGLEWSYLYLESFKQTIGGGTSEIQRNIIGERVLGLPRG